MTATRVDPVLFRCIGLPSIKSDELQHRNEPSALGLTDKPKDLAALETKSNDEAPALQATAGACAEAAQRKGFSDMTSAGILQGLPNEIVELLNENDPATRGRCPRCASLIRETWSARSGKRYLVRGLDDSAGIAGEITGRAMRGDDPLPTLFCSSPNTRLPWNASPTFARNPLKQPLA